MRFAKVAESQGWSVARLRPDVICAPSKIHLFAKFFLERGNHFNHLGVNRFMDIGAPARQQTGLQHRWRESRWLSAAEFLTGAGIVIGHNVFHVVPNEVPILFVIGWISIHFRNGGWKTVGLRRPKSWKLTLIFAASAAAVRILLGILVVDPISARVWPPEKTSSVITRTHGDVKAMLVALLIIWTFAAFGEELGYRGYLLNRGAEVGNRSLLAYWLSMLAVAVLFGYGHWYKGPAAILDSGTAGLVLGSAYLLSKRNLWVPILAHGLIDTVVVVATFLGWAN